jgi:Tripartite tricarboxylate transporter TctB family
MSEQPETSAGTRAVIGMRAMELIVAGLLLAFGLTIAYASYQLGAGWAEDGPRAGYFPFYIGLIISISSVITLVQALLNRTPKSGEAFVESGQLKLVFAVLAPALVYVLVIQWFGIYAASAIYMAVFMMWLGNYAWWKAVLLGIAVSASVFLMFEIWFKVPLHKGTLYNPLAVFGF